jgi:hypothetical protein
MSKDHMETYEHYIRGDEDTTTCSLIIQQIETGERHLIIHDSATAEQMRVGFTNAIGGGCSPNTYKALKNLALAIKKDNEEHPMRVRDVVTPKQIKKNQFILNEKRRNRDKKQGRRG